MRVSVFVVMSTRTILIFIGTKTGWLIANLFLFVAETLCGIINKIVLRSIRKKSCLYFWRLIIMKKLTPLQLIAITLMVAISLTQLFGLGIAGVTVLLGVVFFFIDKTTRKVSDAESGFDIKLVSRNLQDKKIWVWIVLPVLTNIIPVLFAKRMLPQYIEHVLNRTAGMLTFSNILLLALQLIILALGEEIAWRAFFQNQIMKHMPSIAAILITSALFSIGHIASGSPIVVMYDIFFIFIDSIIFGIIFLKTKNAWCSFFAHLLGNITGVMLLLFLR